MNRPKNIAIVGVGNIWRSDDGVGIAVARAIKKCFGMARPHVEVMESDGEITRLLDCFGEFKYVYLIDAICADPHEDGAIIKLDALKSPLQEMEQMRASTHAMGIAQAIEMARAMGRLPVILRIFAIKASRFDHGNVLSKSVADSVKVVSEMIMKEIQTHA